MREGPIGTLLGLSLGALGLPWELLGRFGVRCWVFWGSLWTLLGCFSGFGGRATAKAPKTFDFMSLSLVLLCFEGPEGSTMR